MTNVKKVLNRLKTFLHPTRGGPNGEGWEFGRDVYITELYETLEGVSGVDHVESLRVRAAMHLFRITLPEPRLVANRYPAGSRVVFARSGGDLEFRLPESIPGGRLSGFRATGLKEGDTVWLEAADDPAHRMELTIADVNGAIIAISPIPASFAFGPGSRLVCEHEAGEPDVITYLKGDVRKESMIRVLEIELPESGADFTIIHRDEDALRLSLRAAMIGPDDMERVFLPDDYLVYSGRHSVEIQAGEVSP